MALLEAARSFILAQDGQLILSEGSVYRGFIQWMNPVWMTNGIVKTCSIWGKLSQNSDAPPADWTKTHFDDSGWFHWREPRVVQHLAGTDIRRYDLDQYGVFRSMWVGLLCLRGSFLVTDPDKTGDMQLRVEFRGGLVAYMNGKEIGRAFLPPDRPLSPETLADPYPEQAFTTASGEPWKNSLSGVPKEADTLKRFNHRIRNAHFLVPRSALVKGRNILALEIHRAPKPRAKGCELSECGLVRLALTGGPGAVPAVHRPRGIQVWNVNSAARVSPLGGAIVGRIWQGTEVSIRAYPLSWGPHGEPLSAIRLVAPRNGVGSGQIVVSSDAPITRLSASVEVFRQVDGTNTIGQSAVEILYGTVPKKWPTHLGRDECVSVMDILLNRPPEHVAAIVSQSEAEREIGRGGAQQLWIDSGAVVPIWVRVRVPAQAPAGDYESVLTLTTATGLLAHVPLTLRVAAWVAPNPRDFRLLTAALHSPDTLALWYQVPLWSDAHFQYMDRTLQYMGEIGGRVVYVPLIAGAEWFRNAQGMVYWVKTDTGEYTYDFSVLERYLDMAQKHLTIEVVCLYVGEFGGRHGKVGATLREPDGRVSLLPLPEYKPTDSAVSFWKPVMTETLQRLAKRGLADKAVVGLIWEQPTQQKSADPIALFHKVWPELKLAQIAHYGGQKGGFGNVPFGHVMSVWGNYTPQKSKLYGARDLPIKVVWHPRADGIYDIRPIASPAVWLRVAERAADGCMGLGPVGMDFWNLPGRGTLEGAGAWNLSMSVQTASALLAPGPDGPATTVRYELFRQGVQEAEARYLIENALRDPTAKAKLGNTLVTKGWNVLAERNRIMSFVGVGQRMAQGEGWRWFTGSGWEDSSFALYSCAGDVANALKSQ